MSGPRLGCFPLPSPRGTGTLGKSMARPCLRTSASTLMMAVRDREPQTGSHPEAQTMPPLVLLQVG